MKIVVSGTVGVGKSTTAAALQKRIQIKEKDVALAKEEAAESIYLKYYYADPTNWATISQLDWLLGRFKQSVKIEDELDKNKNLIVIQDRHLLDDFVFSKLPVIIENTSIFQRYTYKGVHDVLIDVMHQEDMLPDYFILLGASLETILERVENRGRVEEAAVEPEFWKTLYDYYYNLPMFQAHFKDNSKNFIFMDTDNKSTDEVVEDIIKEINKTYNK